MGMRAVVSKLVGIAAQAIRGGRVQYGRSLAVRYHVEAFDLSGRLKWQDSFYNLVVTAGLNDALDKHLKGSAYTAAWYVGITGTTPSFAAGDTMSSHAGWTEVTAYTEGTREVLTLGTVSGGSVDNSASKASFSINADTTVVGGAFVTSDDTMGGTTGVLYGGGALSAGDKSLDSGDTLNITVTLTATAS